MTDTTSASLARRAQTEGGLRKDRTTSGTSVVTLGSTEAGACPCSCARTRVRPVGPAR